MNTKKLFKRLTAVAAGATMLGATIMGAAAADLSSYPDSFVSEGVFDGYFVVGESASSVDNLAMTDIATNMWYTADGETTTTTVEGDSWLATTSSNFLELGEVLTDIESELDDEHLSALADNEISNSKGTADYEQTLTLSSSANVTFMEDDSENVEFIYYIADSDMFAKYELDFQDALESDIDTNDDWEDIEDEEITMLGKTYTIVATDNSTKSMTLMGGAVSDTLSEGETQTYEINGVEYEVEMLFTDGDDAQFAINGQTTNKLADGETDVLEDGTNIGVTSLSYQGYAGGIHSASFFIGADKVVLTDGSTVEVNEETISGLKAEIDVDVTADVATIDGIVINMTAQDDYYVLEGEHLSENAELDEVELLFTENWDIYFESVDVTEGEDVSLTWTESDEQAVLTFDVKDGEIALDLVHGSSNVLEGGDDDDDLIVFNPEGTITKNDIFFLATEDTSAAGSDAETYILQYRGADQSSEDSPKATIRNLVTGEDYERSHSDGVFDVKLGGVTYEFHNVSDHDSDDFNITLTNSGDDFVYGESGDNAYVELRTASGHLINITEYNSTTINSSIEPYQWVVEYVVDNNDLFDDSTDSFSALMSATITATGTSDELQVSEGTTAINDPEDSDIAYARSNYGSLLTVTSSSDNPDTIELEVPAEQAQVMLYVTSGDVTTTSTSEGALTQVQIVDATKLDSEISSVSAQNLIVVGGPCVNTVAAELLGNPSDCTEGFTPGVARVKMIDNGDYMAMLVAGYSGDDTRLAGQVLAHNYENGGLSGEEVEIEGTTYSDATVSEPTEEVVEEVVEEEATEEVEETTEE